MDLVERTQLFVEVLEDEDFFWRRTSQTGLTVDTPISFRVRSAELDLPGGPYRSEWATVEVTTAPRMGGCPDTTDTDGDRLPDCWETTGIDWDGDSTVDIDLPSMGAGPMRADIFLEIDCLISDGNGDGDLDDIIDHTHCPTLEELSVVAQSFADAPVPNPDGTEGVQVHFDVGDLYGAGFEMTFAGVGDAVSTIGDYGGGGDQIPEAGNEIIGWGQFSPVPATNFYDLKAANFDPRRAEAFRYGVIAHQTNMRRPENDCTGGVADGIPGNDFLVTKGGWREVSTTGDLIPCWEPTAANGIDDDGDGAIDEDPWDGIDNDGDCPGDTDGDGRFCDRGDVGVDEDSGYSVASDEDLAGTFMHELGHAVGLRHGSGDHTHYKPNYLSVMNYLWSACDVPSNPAGSLPGLCDYSRLTLPTMQEAFPGAEIGDPQIPGLDECAGRDNGVHALGPVNWNGNTDELDNPILEGVTCPAPNDFNIIADINFSGAFSSQTPVEGFDDWSNLNFDFTSGFTFANGIADPVQDEPDPIIAEIVMHALAEIAVTEPGVNEAPEITSDGGGASASVSVPENQTAVTDVESTDDTDSEGSGLIYTTSGGVDESFFSINSANGELSFKSAPDFENPLDSGGDNGYDVQVTVTDTGELSDVQDIAVTVTGVNEAPDMQISKNDSGVSVVPGNTIT